MTVLDAPVDPRIDPPGPQAVIRDALLRQRRRRRRVFGGVLIILVGATLVTVIGHGGGGQAVPSPVHPSRPGSSPVSPLVPGSPRALSAGQYVLTRASVEIEVDGLGPSGRVAIPAITRQWTNDEDTCLHVAFGTVGFGSSALRSAWTGSGLSVTPLQPQPQGFCVVNVPGGGALANSRAPTPSQAGMLLGEGVGVIDVGGLSTDPSTLAGDLEHGHTGIGALDHAVSNRAVASPGFERAVLLLRSPLVGETSAFRRALLEALPLIPGVVGLGPQRGTPGPPAVGFAEGKGDHRITVLLDGRTGQLVEAGNVSAGTLFRSVGMMSFWNPSAPTTQAGGAGLITLTLARFTPVGPQQIVGSLPRFGFPM